MPDNSRSCNGIERPKDDGHLQRSEVGVHPANLFQQTGVLGVVLIEVGALEILGGKGLSARTNLVFIVTPITSIDLSEDYDQRCILRRSFLMPGSKKSGRFSHSDERQPDVRDRTTL